MNEENIINILEYRQRNENIKTYCFTETNNFMIDILYYLRSNAPALIILTRNIFQTCKILDELDGIILYEICENWNKFILNHSSFFLHSCYFNSKRMVILVKNINSVPEYVIERCQVIHRL